VRSGENMKNKAVKIIVLLILILIILFVVKYILILGQYKEITGSGGFKDYWGMTQHPFYSKNHKIEFLSDDTDELKLNLWWKSVTGNIELKISDEKGNVYFSKKADQMQNGYSIALEEGKYELDIDISNFTGAVAIGYENIYTVKELPDNNYSIIPGNPSKGFDWDYILYIPGTVNENKLLVAPNNTGKESDYIDIHKEKAKELIMSESTLAEELGTPLLVPVFPRPASHDELYTHALDRGTILTNISTLNRLDLQLIAMIDDSKKILAEKGIKLDEKILMSGFSASGDFVDRFTFLHPEIVKAAVIGGSDNIVPCESLNGENLPYPMGVYDYEKITGKKFDVNLIANVYRYIYKGSEDEGGWYTSKENDKTTVYTGKEYYEKIEAPQIIENLKQRSVPIYINGDITDMGQKEISFRAYNGKILTGKFLMIRDIFSKLDLDRNEFKIYEGVGHDITEEIKRDELDFFKRVLKN
jgi:hypothetical protein